ncbi:MAG: 16S rRNA processing protein RimM [Ignavibacteriaceae bacterium]|nr:16S rRNA processing protein RimM [Ignavibacteriaceae bacterium]
MFRIAKVSAADEKRGYFVLELFTDFPEKLLSVKDIDVLIQGKLKKLAVEEVALRNQQCIIRFKGIDPSADKALFLQAELFLPDEMLETLPEGYWYIHDLIGSEVYKNGELFGCIEDVLRLKTNDVWQIRKTDGTEYLLPALREYISEFQPEKKTLILKEGAEYYED